MKPEPDAERAERELRERAKLARQSVDEQREWEELVRKAQDDPNGQAQVAAYARESQERLDREYRDCRDRAREEQAEVERQIGIHQPADQAILAGASSDQIEHAGSHAVRPAQLVLAGYVARSIVTTRGYEAVAYTRPGDNRPALVDYGNQITAYGAASTADHRARAAAMIELGTQKGWNTRRFWGSEAWLKATYIEARRAGVAWCVDQQRSAYVPDAATLAAWAKEAQTEAATGEFGAGVDEGAGGTPEKSGDGETEEQTTDDQPAAADRFGGWTREEMLARLQHLRRKHGCEFEDDDEQDREGPSYGA